MTHCQITIASDVQDLSVGLVEAAGVSISDTPASLVELCSQKVAEVAAQGAEGGDQRRQAVRRLLRHGGFKPSGRNKPAQEYLLRTAGQEGDWPTIYNAVDALNVVSLRSGLPISLVALNRLQQPLVIRYGQADESFVFNQAGQTLKVEGLICICQASGETTQPVGTPVKDSMVAKVTTDDTHILACIFAPRSEVDSSSLEFWCGELADGIQQWCKPESVTDWVI